MPNLHVKISRRSLFVALSPMVAAAVGILTNILTNSWNWTLFGALIALVVLASIAALIIEIGGMARSRPAGDEAGRRTLPASARNGIIGSTLPRRTYMFTGREEELARLTDQISLTSNEPIVCAISGMPGIGKTALAIEVGYRLRDKWPDGQLFLNFRAHIKGQSPMAVSDALEIFLSVLGVPGEEIPATLDGRLSRWRSELSRRSLLLVLDDVASVDQIQQLLPAAEGCFTVVTSRERLYELDAHLVMTLSALPDSEAKQLLTGVIGDDRVAADPDRESEVVQGCGGLPLALKLAASWLKHRPTRTIGDLASWMSAALDPVNTTIEMSYAGMSDELQRLLRHLSLHPGPHITAQIASSLDELPFHLAADFLDELYEQNLLLEPLSDAPGRYRIHDLIREYARRKAENHDTVLDRTAATMRLMDYYLQVASVADRRIGSVLSVQVAESQIGGEVHYPQDADEAFAWFDSELPNLLACCMHGSNSPLIPHAWQLPVVTYYFLRVRGYFRQAKSILDNARRSAEEYGDALGLAQVHAQLGDLAMITGDRASALEDLARALRSFETIGNRSGMGFAHTGLGHVARHKGNVGEARTQFTASLECWAAASEERGVGYALINLAVVDHLEGDYEKAHERLQRALETMVREEDSRGVAYAHAELASVQRLLGEYYEARRNASDALDIYVALGNRYGQAKARHELGVISRLSGDDTSAQSELTEAVAIYTAIDNKYGAASSFAELGKVYRDQGEIARAQLQWVQAREIYAELENPQALVIGEWIRSLE